MHLKVFTKCQMLCNAYDDMSGFSILNTRGVTAALWSMRATDGSKRPGREYGRWVSVFMSLWATATSCSTELLGYIFETFNKLTCCIISNVYVYLCLSQKKYRYFMEYRSIPSSSVHVEGMFVWSLNLGDWEGSRRIKSPASQNPPQASPIPLDPFDSRTNEQNDRV